MSADDFTHPNRCPETLNRQALLLSFRLLRPHCPALALRIRNSDSPAALSPKTVHEAVEALSSLSRESAEPLSGEDLLTVRKLLLVWMEFEMARLRKARR